MKDTQPKNRIEGRDIGLVIEQLANPESVSELRNTIGGLIKRKALASVAKHESFAAALGQLTKRITKWEPLERAAALSVIGHIAETIRNAKSTRILISQVLANSSIDAPAPKLLMDANDRYYLAIAISLTPEKVTADYAASAVVEEETGEAARGVFISLLLDRVPDLATAFDHLAEKASTLKIDTKDPGESRARRLVRIAAKLRPAIATRDLPAGEHLGQKFAKWVEAFLSAGEIAKRRLRVETTMASLGILYELVRARFSLVTAPKTFDVVDVLRDRLGWSAWPREATDLIERIASQLMEGIGLLARQGVTDTRMRALLIRMLGEYEGSTKLKMLAETSVGLSPTILRWIATGTTPRQMHEDALAAESVLLEFDAFLGKMMRDIIELKLAISRLQDEAQSQIEIIDPSAVAVINTVAMRVRRLDESLRLLSNKRALQMRGEPGEIVEFKPTEHEQTPEVLGSRLVRIRAPLVERVAENRGSVVVLKADVDPT